MRELSAKRRGENYFLQLRPILKLESGSESSVEGALCQMAFASAFHHMSRRRFRLAASLRASLFPLPPEKLSLLHAVRAQRSNAVSYFASQPCHSAQKDKPRSCGGSAGAKTLKFKLDKFTVNGYALKGDKFCPKRAREKCGHQGSKPTSTSGNC